MEDDLNSIAKEADEIVRIERISHHICSWQVERGYSDISFI